MKKIKTIMTGTRAAGTVISRRIVMAIGNGVVTSNSPIKGTLMQIWKSYYLCLHMKIICWRFRIKAPFTFWDIRTWDMWKFVWNHSETMEYVKNQPTFEEIHKLYGQITREFLRLRMRNFQGIAFIWTQTYWEIFKSDFQNRFSNLH